MGSVPLLAFIEWTKQFAASLVAQTFDFQIQMAATYDASSTKLLLNTHFCSVM
jgi:hypothetical protein